MAGTTLPLLTAITSLADADIFLTRQNGDTTDKKFTGTQLKAYLKTYNDTLYQPLDSELTALAGLTSAANKLPYFTGSGTASLADLSAFGRSLIDDASAGDALTTLGVTAFAQTILDDTTASAARTTLGLAIGSDVQAYDAQLASIAGLTPGIEGNFITADGLGGYQISSVASARTYLNVEDGADVTDTANVTAAGALMDSEVTSLSGIKTLTVPDSTTISTFGASLVDDTTASAARTTLGVAIGSDVQAYSANLAAIAALAVTDGNFIVGNGTTWVAESGSTARTSLGLGSLATLSSINNSNWSGTDLSVANGGTGVSTLTGIVKGNGTSAFSAAVQGTDYYAPSGTDVAIADGGTGASTAAAAFSNLKQAATTTATGVVEKATAAEVKAETADKFPDAADLVQHQGIAKVWADIDMTGTATLDNSYNVTSITDNGTGDVTVTFDVDFANANYVAVGMTTAASAGNDEGLVTLYPGSRAVGSARFQCVDVNNAADNFDYDPVMIAFFGEQ